MKILSFFIIASTIYSAFENSNEDGIITMTTSTECVCFQLNGSGSAIVDWGDGSKKDTVELKITGEYGCSLISRTFFDTIPRTITITGKNITDLICASRCIVGDTWCNQFTALDVSHNAALTNLDCERNLLTELDVSKNTALTRLSCNNNQLTKLDISRNTALLILACGDNQLTELDVSKNTALEHLLCGDNPLTKLDVSKNFALKSLSCRRNQLTKLDISRNTSLTHLYCCENPLTELDLSRNTELFEYYCNNNPLIKLDLSRNIALKSLSCSGNQLNELDVSKNTALIYLWCGNNQLTADALNHIFDTLHDNVVTVVHVDEGEQIATKTIHISNNPGTADCDRSIAERKGWAVEQNVR